jgi:hypothetical protein
MPIARRTSLQTASKAMAIFFESLESLFLGKTARRERVSVTMHGASFRAPRDGRDRSMSGAVRRERRGPPPLVIDRARYGQRKERHMCAMPDVENCRNLTARSTATFSLARRVIGDQRTAPRRKKSRILETRVPGESGRAPSMSSIKTDRTAPRSIRGNTSSGSARKSFSLWPTRMRA